MKTLRFFFNALFFLSLNLSLFAQERIQSTTTDNGNTIIWSITEPNVAKASEEFPQIVFTPNDKISITAGGCVQTGGHGKTWKSYVNPSGPNSENFYSGLISVPGLTLGLVRISNYVNRTFFLLSSNPNQKTFLTLGYQDNNYSDNGYMNRNNDNGTEEQCQGQGNAWVTIKITHNRTAPAMTTRRIAGTGYFTEYKPDRDDGYSASNGFLLVRHNPGCGVVGNDGSDKFFISANKLLPIGCTVVNSSYAEFWPNQRGYNTAWSWFDDAGSYGAYLENPDYTIRWHNACTGQYNGKNLYYVISFVVSMPVGTDLGEPSFDPNSSMLMAFQPPAGYGWVQVPPPNPGGTGSTAISKTYTANFIPSNPPTTSPCLIYSYTLGTVNGPYGNLTSIKNINSGPIVLVGSSQVTLGAGATTTAAQMQSLFGNASPALPVTINICGDVNRQYLNMVLNYNCTTCNN